MACGMACDQNSDEICDTVTQLNSSVKTLIHIMYQTSMLTMYQLRKELLYGVHEKTIQYSCSVDLNFSQLAIQAMQLINTWCQLLMSHIYHYVDYGSHTKTRQLLLRLICVVHCTYLL